LSMRTVMGNYSGAFSVHTDGFTLTADSHNATPLWLAVRYKDTVLSPQLDPYYGSSVFPWEGNSAGLWAFTGVNNANANYTQYVRLGELGGQNDKVWRTAIYKIDPGTLLAQGGVFQFSIGYPASYGCSSLYG